MYSTPTVMLRIGRALDNYGVGVVMDKLSELGDLNITKNDKEIESFIISETCKTYMVDRAEISTSKNVRGVALTARDMCFVLLKKHIEDYTHDDIAKIFKKKENQVSLALKRFTSMNTKIKHEKEFIEEFSRLNTAIKEYKNQLNQLTEN
jgi:hypothetical protein